MFPYGNQLYTVGNAVAFENVEVPIVSPIAPSNTNNISVPGKLYLQLNTAYFVNLGNTSSPAGTQSNWVQLVSSTGNVLSIASASATQITVSSPTGNVVLGIPTTFIAPGSIAATVGNITATNGNLVLGTAGNKITIATGTNASAGVTAAMTTGAVTTATTAVTANSIILYSPVTPGGTVGTYTLTKSAGVSFTITSTSGTETTNFNYIIIN